MTENTTRRASTAYKAAMAHVSLLTEITTDLRKTPQFSRKIDSIMGGILPPWTPEERRTFTPDQIMFLGSLLGELAVSELWKRNGRVIYDLHPELADALYRSRMSAVPGHLFERLPHINPMVIIPDPWPAGKGPGKEPEGYVRAFFIVGISGAGVCDTNSPDRDGIALMFCYDVPDEETGQMRPGKQRDLIPLPTHLEKFSAEDVVRYAEEWQGGDPNSPEIRGAIRTFRPLIQRAFAVLTYLCTDNRDLMEEPAWRNEQARRRKTGKGRQLQEPEPFWTRVGWYVGPQLHTARQRAMDPHQKGIPIPSGVEYGPQHRAGHFKTVWIGPGKAGQRGQSTTVWVQPYWTKLEDLPEGTDAPTQVVPVVPQRKDPLRRRGTLGR